MNLPEGYMLELLRNRFAKATHFDPMLLLALTGRQSAIGRVALHAPEIEVAPEDPVSLSTLLASEGTHDLFKELAQRYLLRTGISGVQPKLLVPVEEEVRGKASVTTSELIVKAAGEQFPGLAANEFICMSIAREAGIPVPEFHLSDDLKRFVTRRFDRTADGAVLGFEDMAVLMNRSPEDKYKGSYAQVARAIELFCPPETAQRSLEQYFDQVALSCMLGNGDAHLKNFGLRYTHPSANDAELSPAYDIVCTTCYIPEDALALTLMGKQGFFEARVDMAEFGSRHCGIRDAGDRLFRLAETADAVLERHSALAAAVPGLSRELRRGIDLFADTYGRDGDPGRRCPSASGA
jgi:serine/threonine-protein kinase HipA